MGLRQVMLTCEYDRKSYRQDAFVVRIDGFSLVGRARSGEWWEMEMIRNETYRKRNGRADRLESDERRKGEVLLEGTECYRSAVNDMEVGARGGLMAPSGGKGRYVMMQDWDKTRGPYAYMTAMH